MGKIDTGLRRSNVDASKGTGASTVPANRSPWHFEAEEPDAGQGNGASPIPADRSPWRFEAEEPEGHASSLPGVQPRSEGNASSLSDLGPGFEGNASSLPRPEGDSADAPPVPSFDPRLTERLVVSQTATPLLIEQFRSLAATLHGVQREKPLKSVIVTSASPGDGKSYVAVNLALTLSDSYHRRVLLIDADLRRPSLHDVFRVPNGRGLSEILGAAADQKVPVVRISENLTFLPAGRPEANPLSGLSSDRMKRIVQDASARFDWVIVDSPPVGVLADARLVAETVDGAILVVRAGETQFGDLEATADVIGTERILGIVLNAVDPAEIRGQGYYRRYYGEKISRS